MAHPHTSIVQQTQTVNAAALGTLGGQTALVINSAFNGITATFLMQRIRYFLQLVGRTAADDGPILVGVARGDATAAEIATAMLEGNTAGPGDTTQILSQDNTWVVYQNTVVAFDATSGDNTEGVIPKLGDWISFGGKNGIPAAEGTGFQLFAFNAGSGSLTTGSSLNGIVDIQGRWLRD